MTTGSQTFSYPAGSSSTEGPKPKESCTVGQRWIRDAETGAWRRIVVANKVLLLDETPDVITPPIVHFVDYAVPWTIWGSGEIQHVENLQYEINKRRGMILDILRFCAMPMLVVDPASGIDHENLRAAPNLVIPAEGGPAAVGILAPQMDLSGLFAVNDRDKQDFNDILGNVDLVQGKAPAGIEAGIALELLSEAANTRLRLKVRLMEASLRRAGLIITKLIQKHYTAMRIFRIVGHEFTEGGMQQQPEFFAINRPVGTVDDQGAASEFENQIPPDAEFDIRIGAGSTLPVSRTARFQQAITLYDRMAIDRKELLKSAAWPRWEEVDARMEAKEMMAQGMPETAPDAGNIPGDVQEMIGPQAEEEQIPVEEGQV
jgi:hypothetical protein